MAQKDYSKTRTSSIKAENKGITNKKLKSIINKEWAELSPKEKEIYYKSDKQHLYTKDEIKYISNEELRRAIYFTTSKNIKTKAGLCKEIHEWFRTTEWSGINLLIPDTQAGKSGGHVKKDPVKNKKINFRIEKIIPTDDEKKFENSVNFKNIKKKIEKLI